MEIETKYIFKQEFYLKFNKKLKGKCIIDNIKIKVNPNDNYTIFYKIIMEKNEHEKITMELTEDLLDFFLRKYQNKQND